MVFSIFFCFFVCKDTTISPNIQGYPRLLSVCVSKSSRHKPQGAARGGHCSRGTQKARPSVCLGSHQKRFSESFPTQRLLCCMEICPPEKLTNVSHFISRGLFCNYQKDVAARRAATSMFWFKENQRPVLLTNIYGFAFRFYSLLPANRIRAATGVDGAMTSAVRTS